MIAPCTLAISPETLSAWRSRALDPNEWRQIDGHIRDCTACQRTLDRFDRIASALRQPPHTPSGAAVWQGVQRRIAAHQSRGGFDQRKLLAVAGLGITGALVIVLTIVLLRMPPSQATSSTQTHPTPVASATNAPINPSATPIPPTATLTQQDAAIVVNNLNFSPQFICGVDAFQQRKLWCDPQPGLELAVGPVVYVNTFAFPSAIVAHDRLTYQVLWRYNGTAGVYPTPIMVQGAILYLWTSSNDTGAIVALDTTTGHILWQSAPIYAIGNTGPDFFYGNGTIFVGSWNKATTLALDAVTGQMRWQQNTAAGQVIALGDTLAFVRNTTGISALDRTSGQVRWSLPNLGSYPMAFANSDTLYVQGVLGKASDLYAFDATGKRLWATTGIGPLDTPPILSGDLLYFSTVGGSDVYAVNATTGHIRWHQAPSTHCGEALFTVPPLQGNVVVMDNSCTNHSFGFRASDGAPLWQSRALLYTALDGIGYGIEETTGNATTTDFDAIRLSDGAVLWQVPLP
jgi:outer membrane protein assembly factor BamB